MTFYLQRNPSGRVILSPTHVPSNSVIEAIEAEDWPSARLQVQELAFNRVDGYGWYLPESR